ncbi:hypothetical protein MRI28_31605 [Nocardiopsis dassonvillei]|uniref:hypothetical protein n=1 Tax=Nocardiopsis dassonvillei TaxID=2014 RepID=UPI00200BF023|nr:hypothetical protein [Nocardiopsis dassonvillei]MCK9874115.1 hypothetical protein [Nocardiopsis dassonvillei]
MSPALRIYRYVGPDSLRSSVRPGTEGRRIGTAAAFRAWAAEREVAEWAEPFTFVISLEKTLLLAPRRSEHVACAGGARVLSAGEVAFRFREGRWTVAEISNQSTGYCPDPSSWPAVANALESAGLEHPGRFTHEFVFRRCIACRELNLVREGDFVCVFCEADLPATWNVDPANGWT